MAEPKQELHATLHMQGTESILDQQGLGCKVSKDKIPSGEVCRGQTPREIVEPSSVVSGYYFP